MRQRETAYQVSTTESETSPRMYLAMAALWLLRKADIKFRLDNESVEGIAQINELLQHGSVIVYGNHTSILDTLAMLEGAARLPHLKRALVPVAQKYLALNRKELRSWPLGILARTLRLVNIEPIEVPQTQDIRGKREINRLQQFQLRVAQLFDEPGTILILTPEATRGDSNQMTRFKTGLSRYALQFKNTPVVPVALMPDESGRQFEIRVGQPLQTNEFLGEEVVVYEQLERQLVEATDKEEIASLRSEMNALLHRCADLFALQVAEMLPMKMRGYYAEGLR